MDIWKIKNIESLLLLSSFTIASSSEAVFANTNTLFVLLGIFGRYECIHQSKHDQAFDLRVTNNLNLDQKILF